MAVSDVQSIVPAARRPLVPLSQAATMLARICDDIDANDDGRPISEIAKRHFASANGALALSVDENIVFKRALDAMVQGCEDAEQAWRARRKQLGEVLDTFKDEVKATIQAEPDVPYSGKLGTLKLQRNGGKAKLVTKFLVREDKVVSNVIDPELVGLFGIDERFIETVTVTRLNTEAVRAELKDGKLSWAELETGLHVRGW